MTEERVAWEQMTSLRLTGVRIRGVGPYADEFIRLEPGLNAFYGLNGTGKTVLLQAIANATRGLAPRAHRPQETRLALCFTLSDPTQLGAFLPKAKLVRKLVVGGELAATSKAVVVPEAARRYIEAILGPNDPLVKRLAVAGGSVDPTKTVSLPEEVSRHIEAFVEPLARKRSQASSLVHELRKTTHLYLVAVGTSEPAWTVELCARAIRDDTPALSQSLSRIAKEWKRLVEGWLIERQARTKKAASHRRSEEESADELCFEFNNRRQAYFHPLPSGHDWWDQHHVYQDGEEFCMWRSPTPFHDELCQLISEEGADTAVKLSELWPTDLLALFASLEQSTRAKVLPTDKPAYMNAKGKLSDAPTFLTADGCLTGDAWRLLRRRSSRANEILADVLQDPPRLVLLPRPRIEWFDQPMIHWQAMDRWSRKRVALEELSKAQARWARFAIKLAKWDTSHDGPAIVVLDEPEAALHPAAAETMVQGLAKGL